MYQKSMGEQVAELGSGLAILGMGLGIITFVVILGGILFLPLLLIGRMFNSDEDEEPQQVALQREAPELPRRLFDAPPHDQWLNAYDYWLYRLEDATNIAFSQSPEGSFVGALIVTSSPALVFVLPFALLDGMPGILPFWIALGALLLFGIFAGWRLTQPAKMFPGDVAGPLTLRQPDREIVSGGIEDDEVMRLGEEL